MNLKHLPTPPSNSGVQLQAEQISKFLLDKLTFPPSMDVMNPKKDDNNSNQRCAVVTSRALKLDGGDVL